VTVDIHALSGAYAVDALDEFERVQFERHLDDCATCRAEVDSLRAAATLLADTSAQPAPDSLRASVLSGIQTVRPLPPVVAAAAERTAATRRRFPALVAAAVALIALGGAGATVWHNNQDDTAPLASPPTVAERVIDAPDARSYAADLDDGARLEVVHSAELDRAVIRATGLPQLSENAVYQLWLDQDGEMVPAGFLDDPSVPAVLHGDAATATSANITVEVAEGAEHPNLDQFVGAVELGA
jgi:hypothetical protein